jgi:ribokinase
VANLDGAFYENSSILCVNETEAELLTGLTIASVDDARAAATTLLNRGPSTVLLTLGAQGTLVAVHGHPVSHIPTRSVKAVDTTVS